MYVLQNNSLCVVTRISDIQGQILRSKKSSYGCHLALECFHFLTFFAYPAQLGPGWALKAHPPANPSQEAQAAALGCPVVAGRAHTRCAWGWVLRAGAVRLHGRPAAASSCECAPVAIKAASRRGASRRGLGRPCPVSPPAPHPCAPALGDAFRASRGGPRSASGVLTLAASARAISFPGGEPLWHRHPVLVAV